MEEGVDLHPHTFVDQNSGLFSYQYLHLPYQTSLPVYNGHLSYPFLSSSLCGEQPAGLKGGF